MFMFPHYRKKICKYRLLLYSYKFSIDAGDENLDMETNYVYRIKGISTEDFTAILYDS